MKIDDLCLVKDLTVDEYGVMRTAAGEKVAIFKSKEMASLAAERMGLLSSDEASDLIKFGHSKISMERVFYWKLTCL